MLYTRAENSDAAWTAVFTCDTYATVAGRIEGLGGERGILGII